VTPTVRERLRWQTATIRRIERRTSTVVSFFLTPSQPFAFVAGQHVDVRLTAPDGYRAERSYSIASAPETSELIELTIERLDDGEVSPYFHDVAAIGDGIDLRGPIGGYFVWTVADPAPVMLVGGGSGIVPFMSMLRHRAHHVRAMRAAETTNGPRTAPPRMLLLFSARTWDDVIYRDTLIDLDSARDGFELAIALTRDSARRAGDYSRRVDTPMMRELLARLPEPPRQVYICGSNPFVEAASQALIAANVPRNLIRTERYGG
jgi:ferredoxin-NADP reductase